MLLSLTKNAEWWWLRGESRRHYHNIPLKIVMNFEVISMLRYPTPLHDNAINNIYIRKYVSLYEPIEQRKRSILNELFHDIVTMRIARAYCLTVAM